ncbi:hypothetical protein KOR42_21550 [Thalassoglobus neptunius]|uniref:Uncharacterized protein n=1 Tax=Thalassoglobus neptunius TaxID=1938619 RepID=A0A5C5X7W2_9PLAN|nr:hypothetical protein KOR42_21550 [Thalassoglobus neptunius]
MRKAPCHWLRGAFQNESVACQSESLKTVNAFHGMQVTRMHLSLLRDHVSQAWKLVSGVLLFGKELRQCLVARWACHK